MHTSERVIPPEPVSVVMPVRNEIALIQNVLDEWHFEVFQYLPEGSELLFDDGGSEDGTYELLLKAQAQRPYIRIIRNESPDGFAKAARRLYNAAACPIVFFTDSDGQYVAAEFWKLTPFLADYDLVHGAKIGRQDPLFRKIASAVFNRVARFIFDIQFSDINSAFRFVRTDQACSILKECHCMPTLLNAELLLRTALNNKAIRQVWVRHRARTVGFSRGLPPQRFLIECWRAYRGLLLLKSESTVAAPPKLPL